METVVAAGADGALLSDLRRDLCLFDGGVIEAALKVIRNDDAVSESRERRPDFRGSIRKQVVLRSQSSMT